MLRKKRSGHEFRGISPEAWRESTVGNICERDRFWAGSERVRSYGWRHWWVSSGRRCGKTRRRQVRDGETGMMLMEGRRELIQETDEAYRREWHGQPLVILVMYTLAADWTFVVCISHHDHHRTVLTADRPAHNFVPQFLHLCAIRSTYNNAAVCNGCLFLEFMSHTETNSKSEVQVGFGLFKEVILFGCAVVLNVSGFRVELIFANW